MKPIITNGKVTLPSDSLGSVGEKGIVIIDLKGAAIETNFSVELDESQIELLKASNAALMFQNSDVMILIPAINFTEGNKVVTISVETLNEHLESDGKTEITLPNTATNYYNNLLIGLSLLVIAALLTLVKYRRRA